MVSSTEVYVKEAMVGEQSLNCFGLREVEVDDSKLSEGTLLVKLRKASLDPYLRGRMSCKDSYAAGFTLGQTIVNFGVGEVVKSAHPDYQVGDMIAGLLSWAAFQIYEPSAQTVKIQKDSPLPGGYYISILGMPGMTAYLGLKNICKVKEGDVVFVSAGAGGVGQLVGQLAKLQGAKKVIGSAGGPGKCEFMKSKLGFDEVIDYKVCDNYDDFAAALKKTSPEGIDVYWDNVGGYQLDAAMGLAKRYARFALCGMISQYNKIEGQEYLVRNSMNILTREVLIQGFIVSTFWKPEEVAGAVQQLVQYLQDGKLHYKLDEKQGQIRDLPQCFLDLMSGNNKDGKLILSID